MQVETTEYNFSFHILLCFRVKLTLLKVAFFIADTSAVQVDESLFQDLEDLELEEDDL